MGGGESTEEKVEMPKEVREALKRQSDKAEDMFDVQSDFFKNVMMPYQKDLMQVNQKMLPFISKNMKRQLMIQHADMVGDAELREKFRSQTADDLVKSGQLGEQLFSQIQDRMDIDKRVTEKRAQLAQEFGRLEKNLVREGIDPTSPEHRAIKKELEMEQARASIGARRQAENEAFQTLAMGAQTFQNRAGQNLSGAMSGSMAGGNALAQQFNVQADTGISALSAATSAQNILSKETTTTTTTGGSSFGDVLAGVGTGALSAGVGMFTGGMGGGLANMAMGALTGTQ